MRLRNRFCHVFGSIRAISVLGRFSTGAAVTSASAACLKAATLAPEFKRRGTAFAFILTRLILDLQPIRPQLYNTSVTAG